MQTIKITSQKAIWLKDGNEISSFAGSSVECNAYAQGIIDVLTACKDTFEVVRESAALPHVKPFVVDLDGNKRSEEASKVFESVSFLKALEATKLRDMRRSQSVVAQ